MQYQVNNLKVLVKENINLEQIIKTLLDRESETTKKVVQMRLNGYSYFEISEKLHISESSARVIFFRVKTKLKKYLEKEGFHYD